MLNICVYCSSSARVAPVHFAAARELGEAIAGRGESASLVYGGCAVGLMGEVARACAAAGGRVVGVIPQVIHDKGLAEPACEELLVTPDLRARKAAMEERADAFIALPGGFGTIEEVMEILTLKQLGLHDKPVVLLDVEGFWKPLGELFEHAFREGFAREEYRELYYFAPTVGEAMSHLNGYVAPPPSSKWK